LKIHSVRTFENETMKLVLLILTCLTLIAGCGRQPSLLHVIVTSSDKIIVDGERLSHQQLEQRLEDETTGGRQPPSVVFRVGQGVEFGHVRPVFDTFFGAGFWSFSIAEGETAAPVEFPYRALGDPGLDPRCDLFFTPTTGEIRTNIAVQVCLLRGTGAIGQTEAPFSSIMESVAALHGTARTNVLIKCRDEALCGQLVSLLALCSSKRYNVVVFPL
jgi:hypothetical protein